MTTGNDRDLFLVFCRGLIGSACARLSFDGARFGVAPEALPPQGASGGPTVILHFSEAEFQTAVAQAETWASSLWPDRPPRQRGVQLMLVHADEDIATTPHPTATYIMTLPGGNVTVRPGPPPTADEAAAVQHRVDATAAEEARVRRIIDEGRAQGDTFEWR